MISLTNPVVIGESDDKFIEDISLAANQFYEWWNFCRLFGGKNERLEQYKQEISGPREIWLREVWDRK